MIERKLRQLAGIAETDRHVLTLYIDTHKNDEAQRDRIRLFLKNETHRIRQQIGGNGTASVENGIRQIEDFISSSLDNGTRGVVLFSRPDDGFLESVELPVSVEPQLTIGSRPQLRQLARILQMHPVVAVAMVDGKTARILKLEFGRIVHETDLHNSEVPRKHEQGGFSQANIQRHVQDHVDRHHREAAEELSRLVENGGFGGVILSGQERNVANFRDYLSKRCQDLLIGTLHLDIRASAEEITAASRELVELSLGQRLNQKLEALQEAAKSGSLGALGTEEVADAVNQRKLQELFLTDQAMATGWRCTSCRTIGAAVPLGCPACGARVITVDLIEEFIAAAHSEGAGVTFVGRPSLLDRKEGVGATLRF
jgi:peptide subunit release factor 1 (eRF1)